MKIKIACCALLCIGLMSAGCGPAAAPSATPAPIVVPPVAPPTASATPVPASPQPGATALPATPPPGATTLPATSTPPVVQPAGTPVTPSDAVVRLALADLAAQLKIPEANIVVKSISAVSWPTSALGCPQAGQMYLQVVTPGYRIILTAGGADYEYHSDRSRVIACAER